MNIMIKLFPIGGHACGDKLDGNVVGVGVGVGGDHHNSIASMLGESSI